MSFILQPVALFTTLFKNMQSQPCTDSTGGSPSPAVPNSDAIDGNVDLEKGGQQGSVTTAHSSVEGNLTTSLGLGNTNTDPSEPNFRVPGWIRRATLSFSSIRQPEPQSLLQWQQEHRVSRIDGHPEGYPQLAAFIDSDENFLMCRRFGWLNSRVLLYRQDELAKLEETLIDMDDEDITYKGGLTLKSRKEDDDREDIEEQYSRSTLINQIDTKLKEYREFSPLYHRHFSPL